LAATILVALTGTAPRVAAETPPPIAFAETATLTLSTEPSRAQLVNNTASARTLVVDAYLDVVDGAVETLGLEITDPPASIAPGGSV
jgi:hypothetical protein